MAKEASDIILLDKDLQKLAFGVVTGRTTFGKDHNQILLNYVSALVLMRG